MNWEEGCAAGPRSEGQAALFWGSAISSVEGGSSEVSATPLSVEGRYERQQTGLYPRPRPIPRVARRVRCQRRRGAHRRTPVTASWAAHDTARRAPPFSSPARGRTAPRPGRQRRRRRVPRPPPARSPPRRASSRCGLLLDCPPSGGATTPCWGTKTATAVAAARARRAVTSETPRVGCAAGGGRGVGRRGGGGRPAVARRGARGGSAGGHARRQPPTARGAGGGAGGARRATPPHLRDDRHAPGQLRWLVPATHTAGKGGQVLGVWGWAGPVVRPTPSPPRLGPLFKATAQSRLVESGGGHAPAGGSPRDARCCEAGGPTQCRTRLPPHPVVVVTPKAASGWLSWEGWDVPGGGAGRQGGVAPHPC